MHFISQVLLVLNIFFTGLAPWVPKYTEGLVGQPRNILPSKAVTTTDVTISKLVFRSLFKYDIYGTLIPDLAETWSISEDGIVYTVKLKDNQYWSNGKKITSSDLIYTSYKVQNLAGVATDRVDDLTVRYTLPNKYSPFLSLLTVGVMPEDSEEKMSGLTPITSGPFYISRIDSNGPIYKQIVLVNNDKKNNIKKLIFRFYANDEELETAGKLGEIDAFLSSKEVELENFEAYKYPLQGVYYALYFNLRDEKFNDVEFRKNLSKVIPLDQFIYDKGISVQGPISRSVFTNKALSFNDYDDTITADYSDIMLRITVPDIKSHRKLAEDIANIWETKFKMDVKVVPVDPDKIQDEVIKDRKFEILFYGQEIGRDPDRYVNWHSTQKDYPGFNISGFSQVRADRALEEGRNEPDSNNRTVHYNELQKVIAEQVPVIFLYHPFTKYYVSDYIEGFGEKYTFSIWDRFLDFPNWKRIRTN